MSFSILARACRRGPALALAVLMALALGACGSAPLRPQAVPRNDMDAVQRQLQAFIAHELDQHPVMGLSIALVDDQRLLWAYGAGWADAAARRPAGPETLYRMGSVSKLFTDTAAMQLVARGRLALDAPIQQALPGFRIGSRFGDAPITARQLMTHHSGLPRDVLGGMWGQPVGDFRALVAGLGDEQAAAPPGRAFGYSNVGLMVLGTAIEQLAGQPFEAWMQQAVLAPLGMDGARFSAAVPDLPRMARGYQRRVLQPEPALRDVPAGGLTASVTDMARFLAMQFARGRNARGEVVLPEPQWAEMLRVQNADRPLDLDFHVGLGWMFSTFGHDTVRGGGPVAHHAGATFHYRSMLMMLPEQRLGVIVASNDAAAGAVVNRVAQRALALMLEARAGVRQPERVPGFVPAAAPWTDAQREACVGDYVTPLGGVSVFADGPQLRARVADRQLALLEGEQDTLGLQVLLGGWLPLPQGPLAALGVQCRTVAGRAVLVARLDGQSLLVGDRLPPVTHPLPAAVAALVGRYEPLLVPGERATVEQVTLLADQGRLWVQPTINPVFGGDPRLRLPVALLSEREGVLIGSLADSGPVIRWQRLGDGRDGFVYAGSTYVRVQR